MDVGPGRGREALPEHLDELGVEGADCRHRKGDMEHRRRPAAEIDGDRGEGFVHRQCEVAVAADPAAFAEGLAHRLAEGPPHVFDGVVAVDMEIPRAADREIEQRVPGEEREHVVEEPQAGGDVGLARAVEGNREDDRGFAGLAGDGGGAVHGRSVVEKGNGRAGNGDLQDSARMRPRAVRKASISASVPTVIRRPSPQPA